MRISDVRMTGFLTAVFFLISSFSNLPVKAQPNNLPPPATESPARPSVVITADQAELTLLRTAAHQLEQDNARLQATIRQLQSPLGDAYRTQQIDAIKRQSALDEQTLNAFRWQGTASNVVLWLVVFITVAGVILSGYQLWIVAQAGQPQPTSELEFSAQKIRVTSSLAGIAILAIACVFLILFLREVYRIDVVDMAQGRAANTEASSGKEPVSHPK